MMMGEREREAEAVELVKQARRRVGFAVEPPVQKRLRLPDGWQKVIADAFAQGTRDLVAKLTARSSNPSAAESPREEIHRPGVEGGDLKKGGYGGAHERDLAKAHTAGVRAGDALVKLAHNRAAALGRPPIPGAVAAAEAERDRIDAVAKGTGWKNDGRLMEAQQLAEALAEPVP